MYIKPDYSTWASMESLSFHEIACLCVGMKPTDLKGSKSSPPLVPEEFLSDIEQSEIDSEYEKIILLLLRAAEEEIIDLSKTGRLVPQVAINYLVQAAKMQKTDWIDQCEFAIIVKSLRPKSNEVDELKLRISELEDEVALYKARKTYTTPMLELVNEVIDQYYAGKKKAEYPKQTSIYFDLSNKFIDGKLISQKRRNSIWDVVSHPSQWNGGNKPK